MAIFTVLFWGDSDKTVSVLYGAKSSSMYFGAAAKGNLTPEAEHRDIRAGLFTLMGEAS